MNTQQTILSLSVVFLCLCLTSCLNGPPTVEGHRAALLVFDDVEDTGNYGYGAKIHETGEAKLSVAKIVDENGQELVPDYAQLTATQTAGGAGKELKVLNSALLVELSGEESILTVRFALEPRRLVNIGVNGTVKTFVEPGPFPTWDGITTFVSYDEATHRGMLYFAGPLASVRFGGKRVWIDNILYARLP